MKGDKQGSTRRAKLNCMLPKRQWNMLADRLHRVFAETEPILAGILPMTIAPEPIVKAALWTLHLATVFCRNWTLHPDVPVEMVNDLMEAIHEVPSILMHWNDKHSFDEIVRHLSTFDERSWRQQVDADIFHVPNLTGIFRDRLQDLGHDGPSEP